MPQNIQYLIEKLFNLYTEENLNKIARRIIHAYREKQFSYIIGLSNLIDEKLKFESKNIQKIFSHLMLLYHPDRINYYHNKINELKRSKNVKELETFFHIEKVIENLDKISKLKSDNNMDMDLEYEYGYDDEDFDSIILETDFHEYDFESSIQNIEFDFDSLMKYRELGSIDEPLPSYFWEELENDLDLSYSNLFDLSGIEKCTNLISLNLSGNQIVDITSLAYLKQIKELNLSENFIYSIDPLKGLKNLQSIDLSFNKIEDCSILSGLSNLKYINVVGNEIKPGQIEYLKKMKKIIIY